MDRALDTRNIQVTHWRHPQAYWNNHSLFSLTEKQFQNGLQRLDFLVNQLLAMFFGSMMALVQFLKNSKKWGNSTIRLFFYSMTMVLKVEKALFMREAYDP